MAFYQRLKDLKEDADLTQAEVSEIIEVSANQKLKEKRSSKYICKRRIISYEFTLK